METTVWTFNLSVPFSEWAKIYDSDDVTQMHASVGIKSLFRGVSKDNPLKVCAVQQAPIGVAQKLFEEMIEKHFSEWAMMPGQTTERPYYLCYA